MVEVSDSRMETFDPIYGVGLQEMRDSLSAERHVLLDDIRHNWYYGWDSEGKPKIRKRGSVDSAFASGLERVEAVSPLRKPLPFLPETPPSNPKACRDSMFTNTGLEAGAGHVKSSCHSGPDSPGPCNEGSAVMSPTAQHLSHSSSRDRSTASTFDDVSAVQFAFASAGIDIVFGDPPGADPMEHDAGIEADSEHKQQFSLKSLPSPKSDDGSRPLRIPKIRKGFATKTTNPAACQLDKSCSQDCGPIIKAPIFDTCIAGTQVQKRSADDIDDATTDDCYVVDDSDYVQTAKKPRLEEQNTTDDTYTRSNDGEVTEPMIEEVCANAAASETVVSAAAHLSDTPCDYPGRFDSPEAAALGRFKAASPSENAFVMGDAIHPHSTITHTNFIPDPSWEVLDYDEDTMNCGPRLRKAS